MPIKITSKKRAKQARVETRVFVKCELEQPGNSTAYGLVRAAWTLLGTPEGRNVSRTLSGYALYDRAIGNESLYEEMQFLSAMARVWR
ncbi:MAG: hypothetical protein ACWGQW_01945 [bacterium]